jgi:RNase adaptor protein for sRNA GlmZ degradation
MDTTTATVQRPVVTLISFGYLHGQPPTVDATFDVRRWLRDPAAAAAGGILDLDGRDLAVQGIVCRTPGAVALIEHITDVVVDYPVGRECVIAVGCAGGRHRSVALVQLAAAQLMVWGYRVDVEHLHVHLPRVLRDQSTADG